MKKVVLITGASSGMGKATAKKFIEAGFTVYGGARRVEKMQEVEGLISIKLDITKEEEIDSALAFILEKEGKIDILFNNAGFGMFGAVECVKEEDFRRQFEVNLFGLFKLCKKIIPIMKNNGGGRIINNSSMGGRTYMPFGAYYHSTKYAIEGFSDCLRFELKPYNIKVVIIEPGNIASEWTDIMLTNLQLTSENSSYSDRVNGMVKLTKKQMPKFTKPEKIADCVFKAATKKNPKTRYLLGKNTYSVYLKSIFGDKVYDKLFSYLISK